MLSVTFDFAGQPVGRMIARQWRGGVFCPQDLQWFERVVRHLGPPLENLFLLRRLRTRAIEGERSRISRDIHDGILQTLLSVDIQLDVLRRKVAAGARTGRRRPGHAAADRAQRDRGAAAHGHRHAPAGRAKRRFGGSDAGFCRALSRMNPGWRWICSIDAAALQVPDRICREIFQIYREALHNVKKHARGHARRGKTVAK